MFDFIFWTVFDKNNKTGKFSREIQKSADTQRWHIPSIDRSVWLCFNADVPVTENETETKTTSIDDPTQ